MKLNFTFKILAIWLLVGFSSLLKAQDSCTFRLFTRDNFGDGWDNSQVFIRLGNNAELSFTNFDFNPNVNDQWYDIRVRTGDTIRIRYVAAGFFPNEISYILYDNAGAIVYQAGPAPPTGNVFTGVARCISCGSPINPQMTGIQSTTARVTWRPAIIGSRITYRVEWDTVNFTPGRGRNSLETTDTFGILMGLSETMRYQAYVKSLCSTGVVANDTSNWAGPLTFTTDTANDVGIARIVSPTKSMCNMGFDTVKLLLKNYGGAPQSLIKFRYSVNGVTVPVMEPAEGLYTGVLTRDSQVLVKFLAPYNFSAPGVYTIRAWTDLTDQNNRYIDRNPSNDAVSWTITTPSLVSTFPYYEDFERGPASWSVYDTVGNTTWELGRPRYQNFIRGAASGVNAWTTKADSLYKSSDYSFVVSPCFDFSSFTTDPRINFAFAVHAESGFDGAFLESSIDNGATWVPVGTRNTGLDWYADTLTTIGRSYWTRTTNTNWRIAQNILRGMAGRPQVRLRFGFRSDPSVNFDGFAFDNVLISAMPTADLATLGSSVVSTISCIDSVSNTLTVNLGNLGSAVQNNYTVSYQVNNGTIYTDTITQALASNAFRTYTFATKPFKTVVAGTYIVKAWVKVLGDNVVINDTFTNNVVITAERPISVNTFPYFQDFETGRAGWSTENVTNSTWVLGRPSKTNLISAYSGNNAWVTNLTGTYNISESGFVYSPCFDFSSFTTDPRIYLAVNVRTEAGFDGATLESSIDGGNTWVVVGANGSGFNWHNSNVGGRASWNGRTTNLGWRRGYNTLTGLAGRPQVRLRMRFTSDPSVIDEGFAFDDVLITQVRPIDAAASAAINMSTSQCGSATDTVRLTVQNLGPTSWRNFTVSYRADNGATVTETVDSLILTNRTYVHQFRTASFNSTASGAHTIKGWVTLANDSIPQNDTVTSRFITPVPMPLPVSVPFTNGVVPQFWAGTNALITTTGGVHGASAATNGGFVFGQPRRSTTTPTLNTFKYQTSKLGAIRQRDSLSYEYRFVNSASPFAGYNLVDSLREKLFVYVSTECNTDSILIDTISAFNHTATNLFVKRNISLSRFAGQNIRINWYIQTNTASTTGFFIDLDNINFVTCPASFAATTRIVDARRNTSDGSIVVVPTAGVAPYTYAWSNNLPTRDSVGGLAAGTYQVTITDARGCSEVMSITVRINTSSISDATLFNNVKLAPNPTSDITTLNVELAKVTDTKVELLNLVGQTLEIQSVKASDNPQFNIDMSHRAAGIYLVRITADNRTQVLKLVRQ